MPTWLIALLLGLLVGLFLGTWIARDSARRKPIEGGAAARLFHYLGCASMTAAPFAGLFGGIGASTLHFFPRLLLTSALGFGCVGLAAIFLLIYALIEAPARGKTA